MPCFPCFRRRALTQQEVKNLADAAETGDHAAQIRYGKYLTTGNRGVEKDVSRGVLLLAMANDRYTLFRDKIKVQTEENLTPLTYNQLQTVRAAYNYSPPGSSRIRMSNINFEVYIKIATSSFENFTTEEKHNFALQFTQDVENKYFGNVNYEKIGDPFSEDVSTSATAINAIQLDNQNELNHI